jgi:ribosomal protein S14
MTFDEFIDTAWNDHGDPPEDVAGRLESSLSIVESAALATASAALAARGESGRAIAAYDAALAAPARRPSRSTRRCRRTSDPGAPRIWRYCRSPGRDFATRGLRGPGSARPGFG